MYSKEEKKKGEITQIAITPETWDEVKKFFGGKK
jgi:hypothetical protein